MAGIDYSGAEIRVRERFSMTKAAADEAMRRLKTEYAIDGCVLLSTCNRTELWISGGSCDPAELLCGLNGLVPEEYRRYLTARSGDEAVDYLFALACGLKSQVFGEDQIVTQVNAAVSQAREADAAGAVLETLFRFAVTAAKKVKSTVRLTGADASVATSTVEFLRQRFGELGGLRCLVIGNGEIGRLTVAELLKAGCEVRMTVRRYHHGESVIPEGCGRISYDERREQLPWARVVVSATSSPHYTLRGEEVKELEHPTLFCDLAVPRDIDPELAGLPGAEVYNTDQICAGLAVGADADTEKLRAVQAILDEYTEEFKSWHGFRNFAHIAGEISGLAAGDMVGRIEKPLRRLGLDEQDEALLTDRIGGAAGKTVGRLLFGLREHLPPLLWRECFDALQKAARGEEGANTAEATTSGYAGEMSATSPEASSETEARGATSPEAQNTTAIRGALSGVRGATTSEVQSTAYLEAQRAVPLNARSTTLPEAQSAVTPAAQNAADEGNPYFPLFVDLSEKKIALFGGGKIAARRAASIRRFCKKLTVISPRIKPELAALDAELVLHPYQKGDCAGFDLVLAATDDRAVNHAIHEECAAAGIPVNVADAPEECGFYFPALAVKDNLVIGITASGTDHKLAKAAARSVREQLETLASERGDEANGA